MTFISVSELDCLDFCLDYHHSPEYGLTETGNSIGTQDHSYNLKRYVRNGRSCMNLESKLKQLSRTGAGPYLRPFAPNSHWNSSKVFIVGTNPATPLREEFENFDDYWESLTSNTSKFEKIYSAQHTSRASKTTRRARKVIAELDPISVLVTNSIAYPTRRMSKLQNLKRHREIGQNCFRLLVEINNPNTILFHGKEACDLCRNVFGITLDRYQPMATQLAESDTGIRLFSFPHFSGVGVQKGYPVAAMDDELRLFSDIARERANET